MRVMVDANILVSSILLESKRMDELFGCIFKQHTLVISSYTVEEVFETARRKFPDRVAIIDRILEKMPYEFVSTPQGMDMDLFEIRDPDDYPVLYTAIKENVDILVTGDKDLLSTNIEMPEIMLASEFIERYA
jgi:putative PIN family toxin of toxin-antitoxin system